MATIKFTDVEAASFVDMFQTHYYQLSQERRSASGNASYTNFEKKMMEDHAKEMSG